MDPMRYPIDQMGGNCSYSYVIVYWRKILFAGIFLILIKKISNKITELWYWYCWWLKSCTSWYGESTIIYRVLAPSQVVIAGFLNHQQYHRITQFKSFCQLFVAADLLRPPNNPVKPPQTKRPSFRQGVLPSWWAWTVGAWAHRVPARIICEDACALAGLLRSAAPNIDMRVIYSSSRVIEFLTKLGEDGASRLKVGQKLPLTEKYHWLTTCVWVKLYLYCQVARPSGSIHPWIRGTFQRVWRIVVAIPTSEVQGFLWKTPAKLQLAPRNPPLPQVYVCVCVW